MLGRRIPPGLWPAEGGGRTQKLERRRMSEARFCDSPEQRKADGGRSTTTRASVGSIHQSPDSTAHARLARDEMHRQGLLQRMLMLK